MDDIDLYTNIISVHKLWEKKEIEKIDFDDYFEIIHKYVKNDSFGGIQERRISEEIADIIREASLGNQDLITLKSISKVISTLLVLGIKLPSEFNQIIHEDPVINTLNTALGHIYLAMMAIISRWRKIVDIPESRSLPPELKVFFESILVEKKERTPEFDAIIGLELNNLEFYDTNWVCNWIDTIFPINNKERMLRVLIGYFYNPNPISKELYSILKQKDIYRLAIHTKLPDRCIRSVSYAIFVGYSENEEKMGELGNLIDELIDTGSDDHIDYFIHIFWQFRATLDEKLRHKVKPIWRKLVNSLQERTDLVDKNRSLARLSWWIELVTHIDEEVQDLLKPSLEVINFLDARRLLDAFNARPSLSNWDLILPKIISKIDYPEYEMEHLKPAFDYLKEKNNPIMPQRIKCPRCNNDNPQMLKEIEDKSQVIAYNMNGQPTYLKMMHCSLCNYEFEKLKNAYPNQPETRFRGIVKFFNETKGYGFIIPKDGGSDVFVHFKEIVAPEEQFRSLKTGEEVEFSLGLGIDGRIAAKKVEIIHPSVIINKSDQDQETR